MHRKALAHLRRADPVMRQVIERVGPCRLNPAVDGTHFDFIARSIIYQQLSGKAAATIYGRVRDLCGGPLVTVAPLLDTADERLRAAGLSRQKMSYLRDLAGHVGAGRLAPEGLDGLTDDEVTRQLVQVNGIGVWTAQMFLMFRLGRPDVFPVSDLGIRKGVQRAYRLRKMPEPSRVAKIGAPWAPYRSVASWYLWRILDLKQPAAA